jgi:MFS family permease
MTQQISTQTDRPAHTHHLGTPLAVYRASVIGSNLVYTVIGALLVGGLMLESLSSHHWVVVFPILLILLLLWGLLESTSWVRSLRMVVCTEGLLRTYENTTESIRWDEIGELWCDRRGTYTFSRADSTRFIVNHVFRHSGELGATIEAEVTRRKLPRLLTAYQRGETLHFGPVQVNRRGISTSQRPHASNAGACFRS